MKADGGYPAEILALGRSVARWRETREKLGPMPETLWSSALELAAKHGVGTVARGSGIAHSCLCSRLRRRSHLPLRPQEGRPIDASKFVEVVAPASMRPGEVCIELDRGDGAQMTIRVPKDDVDLGSICAAFWSR